jgi:hypothetical protein
MTGWKLLAAVAVAAVGFSSRADAQVSVSIPGVGSATFGNGSTYYSPYGYGQSYYAPSYGSYYVVPSGYSTGTYSYPTYSGYYSGTTYAYPTTYGTSYSYPMTYSSGYSYPTTYSSGYYSNPSYYTSGYYPNYTGYYNPGWGWSGYGNTTFGEGFQRGVIQGAVGVPNWYGWGGTPRGTVGNYLGRELGRAIFD